MPRSYTTRQIAASQAIKADDLNRELTDAARQFNGGIDQHQVPLEAIVRTKIAPPEVDYPETYTGTKSTYGASSSYHRSVKQSDDEDTPDVTIDPGEDDATAGWRSLWPLRSVPTTDGVVLELTAREGMIRGEFHVDVERRLSYLRKNDTVGGPDIWISIGKLNWLRFGVFANGSLIADTGLIYPRRTTVALPFAAPAPAGYCRIEAMFIQNTLFQIAENDPTDEPYLSYPDTGNESAARYKPINFFSTYMWARNQYR